MISLPWFRDVFISANMMEVFYCHYTLYYNYIVIGCHIVILRKRGIWWLDGWGVSCSPKSFLTILNLLIWQKISCQDETLKQLHRLEERRSQFWKVEIKSSSQFSVYNSKLNVLLIFVYTLSPCTVVLRTEWVRKEWLTIKTVLLVKTTYAGLVSYHGALSEGCPSNENYHQ